MIDLAGPINSHILLIDKETEVLTGKVSFPQVQGASYLMTEQRWTSGIYRKVQWALLDKWL